MLDSFFHGLNSAVFMAALFLFVHTVGYWSEAEVKIETGQNPR
jgi:hypothetical protein